MMKLCILMGGTSNEREVSIFSGNEILSQLDKSKYDISTIEIPGDKSTDWVRALLDNPPDLVLSALHGGKGEDGSIQGLLECLNIPYVGSKVLSSAICLNKYISKMFLRANHIPVADDLLVTCSNDLILHSDKILNEIGYPLIAKPNHGGSSIGVVICENQPALETAVDEILANGDEALLEQYIKGNEVTVGIVEDDKGLQVMPVLDIKPRAGFFDYQSKYFEEDPIVDFSGLPDFMKTMIQEIAKKTFLLLDCRGYGRVDMIVYQEQVVVLEMNTLPGLTSHSLIPKAASDTYGGFEHFLDQLISYAYAKSRETTNEGCVL